MDRDERPGRANARNSGDTNSVESVRVLELLMFAELAKLAYSDTASKADVRTIWNLWNDDEVQRVFRLKADRPHGFALAVVTTRSIVFSFRGTDSYDNVITDLSVVPTPWNLSNSKVDPNQKLVHGGFLTLYAALREQLIQILADHLTSAHRQQRTVQITGHSLGGALATLAAVDTASLCDAYAHLRPGNIRLYTFGAPRVVKSEFATTYHNLLANHKLVRVFTTNDPLCSKDDANAREGEEGRRGERNAPSVLGELGFKHVGCPLELDNPKPRNRERFSATEGTHGIGSEHASVDTAVKGAVEKGMAVGLERGMMEGMNTGLAQLGAWAGAQMANVMDATASPSTTDRNRQGSTSGSSSMAWNWVPPQLSRAGSYVRGAASSVLRNGIHHSLDHAYYLCYATLRKSGRMQRLDIPLPKTSTYCRAKGKSFEAYAVRQWIDSHNFGESTKRERDPKGW
eukprot:CAMPEP_0198223192 /NCGR_PEP_ID=MMETSP1445-20131203/91456_1 /TAXON_ID=36898 /ORGANISM="Pyramimonas sp., Strain CCMP2087" /LENGTH=457 /DNA_ID=CAMNT_0043901951 /DNA_START=246 /DNA_END=1617 /DNA_ORIENTATION=+